MKYRHTFLFLGGMLFLGISGFAYMQAESNRGLDLTIDSEKQVYELGEPISFSFELKNEGGSTVTILDEFGVGTGMLQVEISPDGKTYVGFNNPGWGIIDTTRKTLIQPTKSAVATGTVLWSWLRQDVPQFRLKESGSYYFRVRYAAHIDGGKAAVNLVSKPIRVRIAEPQGENLEVWNKIKNNGNFAYLIQEGDFLIPDYKSEERAQFQSQVEQILVDHPSGSHAQMLRESLYRYRAKEADRGKILRELQIQKPR